MIKTQSSITGIILLTFVAFLSLLSRSASAQQDTTRTSRPDTLGYNPNAIAEGQKSVADFFANHIGADLFATGEYYGFHLGGPSSTTMGGGPGIELRYHPVFLGFIAGVCGDEGIPGLHESDNAEGGTKTYSFTSVYGGVSIDSLRIGVGVINAGNSMWVTNNPSSSYTSAYFEVSRRIGGLLFIQPQVKVLYPVVAHFYDGNRFGLAVPVTRHYHFGDLYFAIGLKLGIGVN